MLGFPTHSGAPLDKETVALLSGVIATSPLLRLSHPPLDFVRWIGGKAGNIFPNMPIPANVEPQVSLSQSPASTIFLYAEAS